MTFTKVSATTSKMAVLMLTLAAFGYAMFSASKVVDDISIPTTHNEALSGPQAPLWQAAIDRELKSMSPSTLGGRLTVTKCHPTRP